MKTSLHASHFLWSAIALAGILLGCVPVLQSDADEAPPDGFRALFDGKTLAGWSAQPRPAGGTPPPGSKLAKRRDIKLDKPAEQKESFYERSLKSRGKWTVQDGILIGEQD